MLLSILFQIVLCGVLSSFLWLLYNKLAVLVKQGQDDPDNDHELDPLSKYHELDWRKLGAVTAVKNQMRLHSCWAFAAIGPVEAIHQMNTGQLEDFSAQELVDCVVCTLTSEGSKYAGENQKSAYKYMVKHGISKEGDYPYKGVKKACRRRSSEGRQIGTIDGYDKVSPNNIGELLQAVKRQAVSVRLRVPVRDLETFKDYGLTNRGVYKGSTEVVDNKDTISHGMVIVGFGTSPEEGDYWILKNCWGEKWGVNGFMYFPRSSGKGLYNINTEVYYPIKNSISSSQR